MKGRFIATAAVLVVASAVIAGCGSSEEPSSDTGTNEDTSITIDGTLSGDDSVTLGDIDTGSGNAGTE